MIAEGLGALTTVMTLSRGPHWNIEKDSIKRVGNAWAAVIEHYFPDDRIGEYSILTGAVIATGAAFGPPLIVDIAKARATAAAAAAARPQRPQPQYTAPPAPEPSWTAAQQPYEPYTVPRTRQDMHYEPYPNPAYEPPPPTAPQPGDLPNLSETELAQMAAMAQQAMQMMGFFSANGNSDTTENSDADTHSSN